jgi:hypothetical protein
LATFAAARQAGVDAVGELIAGFINARVISVLGNVGGDDGAAPEDIVAIYGNIPRHPQESAIVLLPGVAGRDW